MVKDYSKDFFSENPALTVTTTLTTTFEALLVFIDNLKMREITAALIPLAVVVLIYAIRYIVDDLNYKSATKEVEKEISHLHDQLENPKLSDRVRRQFGKDLEKFCSIKTDLAMRKIQTTYS